MESHTFTSSIGDALMRPSGAAGRGRLSAWDDRPVHQAGPTPARVDPDLAGWAERFYFNLIRPSGEIAAIIGGGVYPNRGVSECYFCRHDCDRQLNVRVWDQLPQPGAEAVRGPFLFRCDAPLRDWSVSVDV